MSTRRRYARAVFATVAVGALVFAVAAYAAGASTATFTFSPNKVPKKTFQKGQLFVETTQDTGVQPLPANNVVLNFDKNFKFNTGAVPKCDPSSITGTDTSACDASQVGTGSAVVSIGPVNLPATVKAFNGKKDGSGDPTILLHTTITGVPVPVILTGALVNSSAGSKYGKALDVPVPPTGGVITDFQTTVKKKDYVSARCHDSNKTWDMKAVFTYSDSSTETQNASQPCKVA